MTLNSPETVANDLALAYAEQVRVSQRKVHCEIRSMLRYMRGQRVLLRWMYHEFSALNNAEVLLDLSTSSRELDLKLKAIGYFWDDKARLWKLRKGLSLPIFTVRFQ